MEVVENYLSTYIDEEAKDTICVLQVCMNIEDFILKYLMY